MPSFGGIYRLSQNWLPREKREPQGEYINVYFEEKKSYLK
jgi:hypothetical protein